MMNIFRKSDFDIATLSVLFEIIIFSIFYLTFGFLYNKNDPLLISLDINFLLILLTTITLFHGLNAGLFLIILFSGIMYIFYKPFPFNLFVENLIIVLICGEFQFFYKRTINKLKEKNSFFMSKFNQLRNSFYLLKLSHDQLEKSFLLKPVSLRSILLDIRNLSVWDEEESLEKLLDLMSKNFGIKSAGFFIVKDNLYLPKGFIGDSFEINRFNVLLNKAIEEQNAVYLSEEFENIKNYEYIAVIPAINCEEIVIGVFIIRNIQFLSFSRENMLTISIIMSIYSDYLTHNKILEQFGVVSNFIIFDPEFNYEVLRLYHLKSRFNIESCFVIFKYKDSLSISKDDFFNFIKDNIRSVDLSNIVKNSIVVLLSMVPFEGARSFQIRINELIAEKLKINPSLIEERIITLSDYNNDIDIIRDYAV